jgi:hypothetical protein
MLQKMLQQSYKAFNVFYSSSNLCILHMHHWSKLFIYSWQFQKNDENVVIQININKKIEKKKIKGKSKILFQGLRHNINENKQKKSII